jgi:tight adherence protein B
MTSLGITLGVILAAGFWFLVAPKNQPPEKKVLPGSKRLQALLDEAGYGHLTLPVVVSLSVVVAVVAGAVVAVVVPIPVVALISGFAALFLGYGFVLRQRRIRQHRLRMAWPGVIDHIRAGIRSGSDITQAIGALPASLPSDVADHVVVFGSNIERGMGTDNALSELGRGLADPVGDRIVEVLRMAHDVGGTDLPDVLLSLQHSVRHDIAVREDAHAKQSWIRSAAVLAVAAPWVVLVVIGTRGDTAASYQTPQGTLILVLGALVSVVAFRMMRSIGALPEQRRWLT